MFNMVHMTSNTQFYPSQWIKCKWSTTNLMPICQDYYIFTVNFWFEKNCRLHLLYDTLSVLYDIFHRLEMQWYEVCNCVSLQIVSATLFVKTHKIDNTVYFSLHYPIDFEILKLHNIWAGVYSITFSSYEYVVITCVISLFSKDKS